MGFALVYNLTETALKLLVFKTTRAKIQNSSLCFKTVTLFRLYELEYSFTVKAKTNVRYCQMTLRYFAIQNISVMVH